MFLRKVTLYLLLSLSFVHGGLFDFMKSSRVAKSYSRGDYNRTKDALLALYKDRPKYNYNLANIYYKLGRYSEAIRYYKRSFGEGVDEHNRLHNLGNSYFLSKEYKRAITAYTYALKFRDDADTQHNLELAQEALKKPKQQKEQEKKKKKEKSKKNSPNKSDKKQKEARKLSKKELQALDELKKRLQHKEEIKKMLQRNFKDKRVPVIMYPLQQKEVDSQEPW